MSEFSSPIKEIHGSFNGLKNSEFLLKITLNILLLVCACSCESDKKIDLDKAKQFGKAAVLQAASKFCSDSVLSVDIKRVYVDKYVDSGYMYYIITDVVFAKDKALEVTAEVPMNNYGTENNSSSVGGEILKCRRR